MVKILDGSSTSVAPMLSAQVMSERKSLALDVQNERVKLPIFLNTFVTLIRYNLKIYVQWCLYVTKVMGHFSMIISNVFLKSELHEFWIGDLRLKSFSPLQNFLPDRKKREGKKGKIWARLGKRKKIKGEIDRIAKWLILQWQICSNSLNEHPLRAFHTAHVWYRYQGWSHLVQ